MKSNVETPAERAERVAAWPCITKAQADRVAALLLGGVRQ